MKLKNKVLIALLMLIVIIASFFVTNYCYADDLGLGDLEKYKSNEEYAFPKPTDAAIYNSDKISEKINRYYGSKRIKRYT